MVMVHLTIHHDLELISSFHYNIDNLEIHSHILALRIYYMIDHQTTLNYEIHFLTCWYDKKMECHYCLDEYDEYDD